MIAPAPISDEAKARIAEATIIAVVTCFVTEAVRYAFERAKERMEKKQ